MFEHSVCWPNETRKSNGDEVDGEVWLGIHAFLMDRIEKCEVSVLLWLHDGLLSNEKVWNVSIAAYLMTFNFLL